MRPVAGPRHRMPRGGNRCDFCAGLFVHKLYACHNFAWDGQEVFTGSRGRWAACEACGGLIDLGNWAQLVTRVMREVRKRKGIAPEELIVLRRDLRLLYATLQVHILPKEALSVQQPHYIRGKILC